MTKEWQKVIREFFNAKNRAWLSGDEMELSKLIERPETVQTCMDEIQALHRSARERGIRYQKSRTNIKEINFIPSTKDKVKVDLVEQLTWFYKDGMDVSYQGRMQPLRILLTNNEGNWKIEKFERIGEKEERSLVKGQVDFRPLEPLSDLRPVSYDRRKAQRYAELWWNGYNPQYKIFDVDCTSYVSQVMYAGGMPMAYHTRKDRGWWYRHGRSPSWSYSWAVANALRWYLEGSGRGIGVNEPSKLMIGDIICYDWDGDGRWQHNTVVVDFDRNGMPLVNAHTVASHRRYWDYKDSYAWTASTKYRFIHIRDNF